MQVNGDIGLGEGHGFGPAVFRRLLGRRAWLHRVAGCLPWGFLVAVGEILILRNSTDPDQDIAIWVATFLAAMLSLTAISRWNGRAIVKAQVARGQSARMPAVYDFDETGYCVRTPGQMTRTDWPAVSEVALLRGKWLFFGPTTFFLPRRLFESPAAERETVAFILARLSPEAQARSKEARALVGGS